MLTFKKFDGISHMVVSIFDTIYLEGLPDLAVTTLKRYHNDVERIIESIYVCIGLSGEFYIDYEYILEKIDHTDLPHIFTTQSIQDEKWHTLTWMSRANSCHPEFLVNYSC